MTPTQSDEELKLKEFTVRTYYYPEDNLVLVYTTYQGLTSSHEKVYKIKAIDGMTAKRKAIKQRKIDEKSKQAQGGE